MKWRILKDEAVGAGNFTDTGNVFDDGFTSWDTYDPAPLQDHLASLGPEYGAEWTGEFSDLPPPSDDNPASP